MSPTIYFIHGTGVRDVSGTISQLRDKGGNLLGWKPDQIVPIEWGKVVGPQPLDISRALPPGTRDAAPPAAPVREDPAALWGLLLADPYAELRVLAFGPSMSAVDPNALPDPTVLQPSARVLAGLQALGVDSTAAAAAGVTAAQVNNAAGQIAGNPIVGDAADKAATYGQIAEVVARATVALVLTTPGVDDAPPSALYDAAAREQLVVAVANALDPDGQRGLIGDFAKRVVGEIASKVAVQKRLDFMGPFSNFIRDVSFYLQHGATMRDFIGAQLRQHSGDGEVVVLGHSLGGIAAVDLLADPTSSSGPDKLRVDWLVTVGSQAPYLYLLDSLASLSPKTPDVQPFQPWLNIYNTQDLLSFCAQEVFPACTHIHDEALHADVPFPASHSAYWGQDGLYTILRRYLPA